MVSILQDVFVLPHFLLGKCLLLLRCGAALSVLQHDWLRGLQNETLQLSSNHHSGSLNHFNLAEISVAWFCRTFPSYLFLLPQASGKELRRKWNKPELKIVYLSSNHREEPSCWVQHLITFREKRGEWNKHLGFVVGNASFDGLCCCWYACCEGELAVAQAAAGRSI